MDKRPSEDFAHGAKKLKLNQPEMVKPLLPYEIKCNPFTYGMLSTQFFLCKECRGFLAGRSITPTDDGTVYLTLKMCGACKQLNQQIRSSVKETMKKDWPSNKNFQNTGGQQETKESGGLFGKPYTPPPVKLTPGQQQTKWRNIAKNID